MHEDIIVIARVLYWIGCGLSFVSYAVRNMLLLRILAIANCLLIIPYYIFISNMALEPIAMAGIIVIINVVNSYALIKSKKPPILNEVEQELHKNVFSSIDPKSMLKLISIGEWVNSKANEKVIVEGKVNTSIIILFSGGANVYVEDNLVSHLDKYRFCGEMTYVTNSVSASASIIVPTDTKLLKFEFEKLEKLKQTNPKEFADFFSILSFELAHKIKEASKKINTKKSMNQLV